VAGSTVTYTSLGTSIVLSTWTYRNLRINGSGAVFNSTGSLSVLENVTLTAGTLDMTSNNYALTVSSSWFNTGGTFTARGILGHLRRNDRVGLKIRSNANPQLCGAQTASGGTYTLQDTLPILSTLTLTAGTLHYRLHAVHHGGWKLNNNGGIFTVNSSSVIFNSTSVGQTIRSRGYPFATLFIGRAPREATTLWWIP